MFTKDQKIDLINQREITQKKIKEREVELKVLKEILKLQTEIVDIVLK